MALDDWRKSLFSTTLSLGKSSQLIATVGQLYRWYMFKRLWCLVFVVAIAPFTMAESAPSRLIIAYEDKMQFPYYIGDDGRIPNEMPGAANA